MSVFGLGPVIPRKQKKYIKEWHTEKTDDKSLGRILYLLTEQGWEICSVLPVTHSNAFGIYMVIAWRMKPGNVAQ